MANWVSVALCMSSARFSTRIRSRTGPLAAIQPTRTPPQTVFERESM